MTLTDVIQVLSIIEFEDKYTMRNTFSGEDEQDREEIRCKIPELDLGEKVVLDAWGSWEVHHYDDYRRRLGVYSVTSKEGEENPHYVLKEEKRFSESGMVHDVLRGSFAQITEITEGLKYISLDRYGRPLF